LRRNHGPFARSRGLSFAATAPVTTSEETRSRVDQGDGRHPRRRALSRGGAASSPAGANPHRAVLAIRASAARRPSRSVRASTRHSFAHCGRSSGCARGSPNKDGLRGENVRDWVVTSTCAKSPLNRREDGLSSGRAVPVSGHRRHERPFRER